MKLESFAGIPFGGTSFSPLLKPALFCEIRLLPLVSIEMISGPNLTRLIHRVSCMPEILPFGAFDLHGLVLDAAFPCLGPHAALATISFTLVCLMKCAWNFFMRMLAVGPIENHPYLPLSFCDDGAGVEDRACPRGRPAARALLDQAAVRHVAAGDQGAGQVDHVAGVERPGLRPGWGGAEFFTWLNPWWEMTSLLMSALILMRRGGAPSSRSTPRR